MLIARMFEEGGFCPTSFAATKNKHKTSLLSVYERKQTNEKCPPDTPLNSNPCQPAGRLEKKVAQARD